MQQAEPQVAACDPVAGVAAPTTETGAPTISWPGYGIMFFWQLGVLQRLEQTHDLDCCTMVGSSAGAMLSVFAACGVNAQAALDLAHQLCIDHRVFQRPLGLMGVWGGIVREWLHTLLPENAADRCSGRVRIVITTLPLLQREVVTSFKDRDDLIDCCLASSHIPFVMDWQPAALCRGRRCVDGSMLYILTGQCKGLRPLDQLSSLLVFDPCSDKGLLQGWTIMRCVLLCGKEGAQQLLDKGYDYAARLDASGGLQVLDRYRKVPQEGPVSSPAQPQPPLAPAVSTTDSAGVWGGGSVGAAGMAEGEEQDGEQQGGSGDASDDLPVTRGGSSSSSVSGFVMDGLAIVAEGPGSVK